MKGAQLKNRMILAALWVAVNAWHGAPAAAQEDEAQSDPIHSDLPLSPDFGEDAVWPQHFTDDDGSFGCTSRVGFGDWSLTMPDEGDGDDGVAEWYRFDNYGVFHCAVVVRRNYDRDRLDEARYEYGRFIRMGETGNKADRRELWAVEVGSKTGSDYILLARQLGSDGVIGRFQALQAICPAGHIREKRGLDLWNTRYCAINSRAELLALARRMAWLKPLGVLELQPPTEAQEAARAAEQAAAEFEPEIVEISPP